MYPTIATTLAVLLASPGMDVRYEYHEDVDREVCIQYGTVHILGKLNWRGEFSEIRRQTENGFVSGWARMPLPLNAECKRNDRPVYELRSGVLIPGTFDTLGYFVPTVGGEIIKFKDYVYDPDGPAIWNLPGEFLPEGKEPVRVKAKPPALPPYKFNTTAPLPATVQPTSK